MNVYKGRLLKKSSNWKSKLVLSTLVSGHYMAFKHCISFATDLATNFGCYRFRITPDIISKLLSIAIGSRCAVLNLSRSPFLGQVVDLDLLPLLCAVFNLEHEVSFLCHILTQALRMSCPSWQWHGIGYRWPPVRTLAGAPLWCDLEGGSPVPEYSW